MDKDETSGPKGKSAVVCRSGHEYVKSVHSTFFALDFLLMMCWRVPKYQCLKTLRD